MPKHDISLTLDFDVGDRVTHATDGDGIVYRCEIDIRAKNKITIYYIVDFSRGSEFFVVRKHIGRDLRLRTNAEKNDAKKIGGNKANTKECPKCGGFEWAGHFPHCPLLLSTEASTKKGAKKK